MYAIYTVLYGYVRNLYSAIRLCAQSVQRSGGLWFTVARYDSITL